MGWLITGGAGYIGSHIVKLLSEEKQEITVIDNLSSGKEDRLPLSVDLVELDICDSIGLENLFEAKNFSHVIHLAARKSVAESFLKPEVYEKENYEATTTLIDIAVKNQVKNFIFSSTAAVYGNLESGIAFENSPTEPISPYGSTKLKAENYLSAQIGKGNISGVSLRYFNVAGAVEPKLADLKSENLIPRIIELNRAGVKPQVFGDDYSTPDGTCVRDYVHVQDIARAHFMCAKVGKEQQLPVVMNIGTGEGSSVLDVINSISRNLGKILEFELLPRRTGDPALLIANTELIANKLDFTTEFNLDAITKSAIANS